MLPVLTQPTQLDSQLSEVAETTQAASVPPYQGPQAGAAFATQGASLKELGGGPLAQPVGHWPDGTEDFDELDEETQAANSATAERQRPAASFVEHEPQGTPPTKRRALDAPASGSEFGSPLQMSPTTTQQFEAAASEAIKATTAALQQMAAGMAPSCG